MEFKNWLIAFFLLAFSLAATADSGEKLSPDFKLIDRQLQKLEDAVNRFDASGMLELIDEDSLMISKNGETAESKTEIKSYISRMTETGNSVLTKLESKGEIEDLAYLSKSDAIGYGQSSDHYVFRQGLDFHIRTPLIFWMAKKPTSVTPEWKIKAIHFGFNLYDNPIVNKAFYLRWVGLFGGLFCGLICFFFSNKKKRKIASSFAAVFFISIVCVPSFSLAIEVENKFDAIWQDFENYSKRGEAASFFNEKSIYMDLHGQFSDLKNHQPDWRLFDFSKIKKFKEANSVLILGTRNLFEGGKNYSINWTMIWVVDHERWKIVSLGESGYLFSSPALAWLPWEVLGLFIFGTFFSFAGLTVFLKKNKN